MEIDITQKDIIVRFKKYLENNYSIEGEKNTIKAYTSDIKLFFRFFEDMFDERIISFSRANIIEYKNYMLKKLDYKPSTINRKLSSLSIYENFLIEEKIKNEKSIRKKDFYKITVPYITSDMLPKKEMTKIKLEAGNEKIRDYLILVFIAEAGLRVSELCNIQIERDINFDMRKIIIWGKGRRIREIIITNAMQDALDDYLEWRNKKLNGKENKYLVISNRTVNTNKPINRTLVNKMLNKYNKHNEIKIHPHLYRHEFATEKYENGYTDMMLKKVLGQTSNATDRYVHPGGEKMIKQ